MASTVRTLTLATRLDSSGIDAGAARGVQAVRSMAGQMKAISGELRSVGMSAMGSSGGSATAGQVAAWQDLLEIKQRAARADVLPTNLRDEARRQAADLQAQVEMMSRQELTAAQRQGLYGRKGTGPESVAQLQEKAALNERLTGMQAAGEAETADRQNRAAQLRGEHRERLQYEDRYFAATHGFRDTEMRRLTQEYQSKRLMHAGNNRMLLTLDKAYAAESAQIMQGEGPMGAKSGKKVFKFAAANMAGEIDPTLGKLAGYGSMGAMAAGTTGAVAFTGIAAGATIAMAAISRYTDRLEELKQIQKELSVEGREFKDIMTPKVETTEAGERTRAGVAEQRKKLDALKEEAKSFQTAKFRLANANITAINKDLTDPNDWSDDSFSRDVREKIELNRSRQTEAGTTIANLSKQQTKEDEKAIFRRVHQMSRAAERAGLGLLTPEVRARKEMELRHGDEQEALSRQKAEYKIETGKEMDPRFQAELDRKQNNEKLVVAKQIADTQKNGLAKYKEAAKDIDNMVGEGKLDKKTADIMKAQQAGSLLGDIRAGVGQQVNMDTRHADVQAAIMKDANDPAKMTAKEAAEARKILDKIQKDGIVIRPAA